MNKENWEEIKPGIWDYKNQPELIGKLVKKEADVGPNKSNLYTVEKEDGSLISIWGSAVLDQRLIFVEIGEQIKIQYLGDSKPKPGRKGTHLYRVFHPKAKHEKDKLPEKKK